MKDEITISVEEYESLLNIETATRIIYNAQINEICPHGFSTDWPIHLWYCDDCWEYLQKTLLSLPKGGR